MMYVKPVRIPLIALLSIMCTSCAARLMGGPDRKNSTDIPSIRAVEPANIKRIVNIESHFVKEQRKSWDVNAIRLPGREDLRSVWFIDQMQGWVAGDRALYKTADSGQTWEQIKIDLPEDAKIGHVFFINPSTGWIVIRKSGADVWEHYADFQFWVEHTIDGGRTWQLQHEEKTSDATRIIFVNDQEGWVTGVRYVGSPARSFHLLLHTLDQGQHWMDASIELNRIAAQVWRRHATEASGEMPAIAEVYSDLVNDSIADIRTEGPLNATLLTSAGDVYRTDDGGQNWKILVENSPDRLSWSSYYRLGVTEDKLLWLASAADSSRGIFGSLKVDQGESLRQYNLHDAFFRDVLFLSDNDVLACGYTPLDETRPSKLTSGVLFYSCDGGNSWVISYRNTDVRRINELNAVDPNNSWAVGDGGLVLRLIHR